MHLLNKITGGFISYMWMLACVCACLFIREMRTVSVLGSVCLLWKRCLCVLKDSPSINTPLLKLLSGYVNVYICACVCVCTY